MTLETDHDFHLRRARSELDLAFRAESLAVSESHLRLSALHMQRLNGGLYLRSTSSNTEQGEILTASG